jgi:uncharacterized protein (TIGR03067 family)
MKTRFLLIVLLCGAWPIMATAQDNDARKELAKLKGTWKLVYEEDSGEKIPVRPREQFIFSTDYPAPAGSATWALSLRNRMDRRLVPKNPDVGLFWLRVPAIKMPRELDFWDADICKGDLIPSLAIYKIEGNKLTICVNWFFGGSSRRPTDFTTNATNRNVLLIMEKVEAKQE